MQLWQIFGDAALDLFSSHWPDEPWYLAAGSYSAQADGGPFDKPHRTTSNQGTRSWPGSPYRHFDLASLDESPSRVVIGAWWKGNISSDHVMMAVADETEASVLFGLNHQEALRVRFQPERDTDSGTEELAITSAGAVDDGTWTFYEFVVERDAGSLTVEVWVDDSLALTDTVDDPLTGDLLCAGLNASRGTTTSGGSSDFHGGYVADTRLGPTLVAESRPATQGAHDEWDPPGAVERVNNDTSSGAVIEGMVGERTTYDLDPFDLEGTGTIVGVQIDANYSAAGAVPRTLLRRDGTDVEGPDLPGVGGPTRHRFAAPIGLDPFTDEPFTVESLDETEFGLVAFDPDEE